MGKHTYPCPICYTKQEVVAPNGQVVEVQPCAACREVQAYLAATGKVPESVLSNSAASLDAHRRFAKEQQP